MICTYEPGFDPSNTSFFMPDHGHGPAAEPAPGEEALREKSREIEKAYRNSLKDREVWKQEPGTSFRSCWRSSRTFVPSRGGSPPPLQMRWRATGNTTEIRRSPSGARPASSPPGSRGWLTSCPIPWIDIAYDGQEDSAIVTRLQAFVYRTKEFAGRKGLAEPRW